MLLGVCSVTGTKTSCMYNLAPSKYLCLANLLPYQNGLVETETVAWILSL